MLGQYRLVGRFLLPDHSPAAGDHRTLRELATLEPLKKSERPLQVSRLLDEDGGIDCPLPRPGTYELSIFSQSAMAYKEEFVLNEQQPAVELEVTLKVSKSLGAWVAELGS
jgi:hypothetical protein